MKTRFRLPSFTYSIILSFLLLFALIAVTSSLYIRFQQQTMAKTAKPSQTYDNLAFKIKINYNITDWNKTEFNTSELDIINSPVKFVSSSYGTILISVEDLLSKNVTIKEYAREKYNDLEKSLSNVNFTRLNDSRNITISGNPAWEIDYSISP